MDSSKVLSVRWPTCNATTSSVESVVRLDFEQLEDVDAKSVFGPGHCAVVTGLRAAFSRGIGDLRARTTVGRNPCDSRGRCCCPRISRASWRGLEQSVLS